MLERAGPQRTAYECGLALAVLGALVSFVLLLGVVGSLLQLPLPMFAFLGIYGGGIALLLRCVVASAIGVAAIPTAGEDRVVWLLDSQNSNESEEVRNYVPAARTYDLEHAKSIQRPVNRALQTVRDNDQRNCMPSDRFRIPSYSFILSYLPLKSPALLSGRADGTARPSAPYYLSQGYSASCNDGDCEAVLWDEVWGRSARLLRSRMGQYVSCDRCGIA
jgi:hypothetical protein